MVCDLGCDGFWREDKGRWAGCTVYTDVSAVSAVCEDVAAWLLLVELRQLGGLHVGSVAAGLGRIVHSCDVITLERYACRMNVFRSVHGQWMHSIAYAVYYSVTHGTGTVVCFVWQDVVLFCRGMYICANAGSC
jgi:hypothetical protein